MSFGKAFKALGALGSRQKPWVTTHTALWLSGCLVLSVVVFFPSTAKEPVSAANLPTLSASAIATPTVSTPLGLSPELKAPALPGLNVSWAEKLLDKSVHLSLSQKPFTLSQSVQGSGSEAFTYSAYLFRQVESQVKSSAMQVQLKKLAASADAMARNITTADSLWFDGTPTDDMRHLELRARLAEQLNPLNTRALHATENSHQTSGAQAPDAGQALKRFLDQFETLKALPESKNYPETMAVLEKQANSLKQLALGLTLEWENTTGCKGSGTCIEQSLHMKLYSKQQASSQTPLLVALSP